MKLKKKNKEIKLCNLNYMSHRTYSYICMYMNAVANCVMLQSYARHYFYNNLCSLRVSLPAKCKVVDAHLLQFRRSATNMVIMEYNLRYF